MVFVLTLIYVSISLLSPAVLPQFLQGIHILQIVGGFTVVLCLFQIGKSDLLSNPTTYLIFGVLLASALSILATGWLGGALGTFMGFVPIIFTFFFIVVSCNTLNRIAMLAYVLCAVSLFITAQGMIAEHSGDLTSPYLVDEHIAGFSLYRHRGLGVISDPNDLAQVLVAVLPLLWLRPGKGRVFQRVFLTYLPAAGLGAGIYFTHSRGGLLALIAVVLFGIKDAIGVIGSSIITTLFTLGALALNVSGGRAMNQDDGDRIALWSQALTAFKTHPLFGIGADRFADYSSNHLTAHNSYVLCLAEMGTVGYFFWVGSLVSVWTGLSAMIRKQTAPESVEKLRERGYGSQTLDELLDRTHGIESIPIAQEVSSYDMSSLALDERTMSYHNLGPEQAVESAETMAASFAHSARAVRTAVVGVLVAAFFISRTYSIILYILLGMATSLQILSLKASGDIPFLTFKPLLKKICYVMAGSILFLYLFVRLHGVR